MCLADEAESNRVEWSDMIKLYQKNVHFLDLQFIVFPDNAQHNLCSYIFSLLASVILNPSFTTPLIRNTISLDNNFWCIDTYGEALQ